MEESGIVPDSFISFNNDSDQIQDLTIWSGTEEQNTGMETGETHTGWETLKWELFIERITVFLVKLIIFYCCIFNFPPVFSTGLTMAPWITPNLGSNGFEGANMIIFSD